jgi:hypothetical protein
MMKRLPSFVQQALDEGEVILWRGRPTPWLAWVRDPFSRGSTEFVLTDRRAMVYRPGWLRDRLWVVFASRFETVCLERALGLDHIKLVRQRLGGDDVAVGSVSFWGLPRGDEVHALMHQVGRGSVDFVSDSDGPQAY